MELRLLVWLGAAPNATPWFALALTYLVHSFVWATAVALLVRARTLSSATRHLYWKMALLGPLLTALVAIAVDGGSKHTLGGTYVQDVAMPSFVTLSGTARRSAAAQPGPGALAPATMPSTSTAQGKLILEFGFWAAALGLLRFLGSALLLKQSLKGRTRVTDRRLLRRFEHLRARMALPSVFMTESAEVRCPLVIGRREICVPSTLLSGLSDAEVDTVLAHELAHVERADGVWFPIVGALQSVLWVHPLNHWLAASFRDSAELACDDRAVELTSDPLGLARALVQVAASASFARRLAMIPTMTRSRSALLPRVKRLTCGSAATDRRARECGRPQAIATLTLLAFGLGAFSVQVAQAHPTPHEAQPKARTPDAAAAAPLQPDALEQGARMAELAQREQGVLAELEAAKPHSGATSEGSTDSANVRVLELSQELRHLRGTQAWLEERFVSEWSAWEKNSLSQNAIR